MEVAGNGSSTTYDRLEELKAFDESKAGVKGLIDSGVTKVPRIFIRPPEDIAADEPLAADGTPTQLKIPVIDLAGDRAGVIAGVLQAAETGGFFQVVNHGIPMKLLEEMLAAVRGFHELPQEVKAEYYKREEVMRKVKYESNFDLYQTNYTNWRDTLICVLGPQYLDPQEIHPVLRDVTMEYSSQMLVLGSLLFELLSEALGLNPGHLESLDCAKGQVIFSHYYPACPEPELTMGTRKHSDPDFLTILLQDHFGGLQVLSQNGWVDVPHVPGALVVNIGDLLQLISNDKFKSVEHRVLASHRGPRVSVAYFFADYHNTFTRVFGPIKELLSDDNPPVYRETTVKDFNACFHNKKRRENSALDHFRILR